MESDLLGQQLQFGSILIANRQPKRAIVFQRSMSALDPVSAEVLIRLARLRVVVDIVFVPDVERRIRKHEID